MEIIDIFMYSLFVGDILFYFCLTSGCQCMVEVQEIMGTGWIRSRSCLSASIVLFRIFFTEFSRRSPITVILGLQQEQFKGLGQTVLMMHLKVEWYWGWLSWIWEWKE